MGICRLAHSQGMMTDSSKSFLPVEICRPGVFRTMSGDDVVLTSANLKAVVQNYNSAHDAPIVLGHPETDAPAYGWVKGLKYNDAAGKLVAELGDLSPAFASAVKNKHYKKISAAFFAPDDPANPKPGDLYLRHVGFLGAVPPAITGLKSVHLAGARHKTITIEFAIGAEKMNLLDKIKEFLAKKLGQDKANELASDDGLAQIFAEDTAEKAQADLAAKLAAAANNSGDTPPAPPATENSAPAANKDEASEEEKKKKEVAFAAREAALKAREAELNKSVAEIVHTKNIAFAASLIAKGQILPAQKDDVVRVLDASVTGKKIAFADGSQTTASALLEKLLGALPQKIAFGATDTKKAPKRIAFAAPDGLVVDNSEDALYARVRAYMAAHPELSFEQALKLVSEQEDSPAA